MTAPAPDWLNRVYVAALALHAVTLLGVFALVVAVLALQGTIANAARESVLMLGSVFLVTFLPALPSIFALLSWWLCRRRGWEPSPGHMGLSIFAAAAIGALVLLAFVA